VYQWSVFLYTSFQNEGITLYPQSVYKMSEKDFSSIIILSNLWLRKRTLKLVVNKFIVLYNKFNNCRREPL